MRTNVVVDEQTYNALYVEMEKPHVTQSWAWGEAKAATEKWDVLRLAFYDGSEPMGLCQVLRKKYLGFPIVSRVNRGPVFRSGLSDADKLSILSELRSRFRFMRNGVLFIAPGMPPNKDYIEGLREIGFRSWKAAGWHSSIIDLQKDTDQIRKGLQSKWRSQLNRSERSGLLLNVSSSEDSLELMIGQHEDHMREKGFDGASGDFLRTLYKVGPRDVVVLVASTGAGPVGGAIIIRHGLNSEYFVGWLGEEGRKLNGGNFLLWNTVVEMKDRGCRWLDLGGFATAEKYGHFKRGMGGDEYDLMGEWICFW